MEHDLTETDEGRDVGLSIFRGAASPTKPSPPSIPDTPSTAAATSPGLPLKAGYPLDVFKQLGLVGTSQQGRDYDRFRGRVIFPILNTSGKVIAFGGRDLKGGLAKYINSPNRNSTRRATSCTASIRRARLSYARTSASLWKATWT